MEPVGLTHPRGKGLAVVHRCVSCTAVRRNRVAADDDIAAVSALPPG